MARLTLTERLTVKRSQLVTRTAQVLDVSEAAAEELLRIGRRQSVRLNTLAAPVEQTLAAMRELGWKGERYDWFTDGYSMRAGQEVLRDSRLVEQGAVYIQNAASWLPVIALSPQAGEKILDMCAAPGGKTGHIAAMTNNHARIFANDNSRTRLMKLQQTCRRLQAHVERYTLYDARNLAYKLAGEQFDKILLDAPCSGEGLMNLDRDKDFETWSPAQIKRLQQLQKRLLAQAWQLLKPGGTLVYSTCTMAPEENEAVVSYALRALEDAELLPLRIELPNRVAAAQSWHGREFDPSVRDCLRLKPSPDIEAFFVARLHKQI